MNTISRPNIYYIALVVAGTAKNWMMESEMKALGHSHMYDFGKCFVSIFVS